MVLKLRVYSNSIPFTQSNLQSPIREAMFPVREALFPVREALFWLCSINCVKKKMNPANWNGSKHRTLRFINIKGILQR